MSNSRKAERESKPIRRKERLRRTLLLQRIERSQPSLPLPEVVPWKAMG